SRQDAAHRVRPVRDCEPTRSGSRQTGVVRLPWVHALLREPPGWSRLRSRTEAGSKAHARQAAGNQGMLAGDATRRDPTARSMACPGPACRPSVSKLKNSSLRSVSSWASFRTDRTRPNFLARTTIKLVGKTKAILRLRPRLSNLTGYTRAQHASERSR